MAYQDIILADRPVNYWRLGESSGNAIDQMGQHNLVWAGTPIYGASGALTNNANTAMSLDGATEYASKSVSGFRSVDIQGSIELWFKTNSSGVDWAFSSGNLVAAGLVYAGVVLVNGKCRWQIDKNTTAGAANFIETVSSFNDDVWHHLVVITDGNASGWKLYINAVLQNVNTTGSNTGDWFADVPNLANVVIGGVQFYTTTGYFNGHLDEVAVYNYPLTSSQILTHYNAGQNLLPLITGTVRDKTGALAARTVTALRESDQTVVATTTSDAVTGEYEIMTPHDEAHTLIFSGETDRNAIVYSGVMPS
jgi:large repetitive protein